MKIFKQKLFQLVLLMGLAIVMFSCYPVCQDCVTYTNQTTFGLKFLGNPLSIF